MQLWSITQETRDNLWIIPENKFFKIVRYTYNHGNQESHDKGEEDKDLHVWLSPVKTYMTHQQHTHSCTCKSLIDQSRNHSFGKQTRFTKRIKAYHLTSWNLDTGRGHWKVKISAIGAEIKKCHKSRQNGHLK